MSPSVEPFDEAKFKALMDGLECSEIKYCDLEFSGRIDAEYYQKRFLRYEEQVKARNSLVMGGLCHFLIGPFGSAYDTSNYVETPGYRYIRGQDVKPFFVKDDSPRYMAESDYLRLKKYALLENDLLISVVGTLGNACIVQAKELPAIFSCKSTAVRTEKTDPYYLLSYLNSEYGRQLLLRKERGAIQKGLNLDDLKSLEIPIFSCHFELSVRNVAKTVPVLIERSLKCYRDAQKLLKQEINIPSDYPSKNSISERSLSKSLFATGRLDAEYYHPKYDSYLDLLREFETTTIPVEFDIYKNTGTNYSDTSIDVGVVKTKQLTSTGIDLESIDSHFDYSTCSENNSTFIRNKDVVFAAMGVGSLGKACVFFDDSLGKTKLVTDSTLRIFRAKPDCKILPEVLCVFLQSPIGQELIYRYVVGSTGIINIYDSDIAKIPIPILHKEIQEGIAAKVQESFALRRKSKELLEYAKRAVEMAIEQGEDAALEWLNSVTSAQEA